MKVVCIFNFHVISTKRKKETKGRKKIKRINKNLTKLTWNFNVPLDIAKLNRVKFAYFARKIFLYDNPQTKIVRQANQISNK